MSAYDPQEMKYMSKVSPTVVPSLPQRVPKLGTENEVSGGT
jgi:hypothetical protein